MIDAVLELFGRIDIVVNNAGMVNVGMQGQATGASPRSTMRAGTST